VLAAAAAAAQHSDRAFARAFPLCILVVEDNKTNMKLVVRMLAALGYGDGKITAAPTGAGATSSTSAGASKATEAGTGTPNAAVPRSDATSSAPGASLVCQAWNGQEAVEMVVRQARHFDLILMDSVLPVMTGPQACRAILEHYATTSRETAVAAVTATGLGATPPRPSLPAPVIVAVTASCMASDRDAAREAGHADFLSKPLSLALLREKLHHWAREIHARRGGAVGHSQVGRMMKRRSRDAAAGADDVDMAKAKDAEDARGSEDESNGSSSRKKRRVQEQAAGAASAPPPAVIDSASALAVPASAPPT